MQYKFVRFFLFCFLFCFLLLFFFFGLALHCFLFYLFILFIYYFILFFRFKAVTGSTYFLFVFRQAGLSKQYPGQMHRTGQGLHYLSLTQQSSGHVHNE